MNIIKTLTPQTINGKALRHRKKKQRCTIWLYGLDSTMTQDPTKLPKKYTH